MLEEIDKYFAIVAAVAISLGGMVFFDQSVALGLAASAVTGIFALAGTGKKEGAQG